MRHPSSNTTFLKIYYIIWSIKPCTIRIKYFISDFLISRACILCSMHHYVTYKYFCLYETRKDGYNPVSHFYTAYHWLPIPPVLQKEWPHDEWCAGQRFSTNLPTPNWFSPGMWGNKNQINWKPTLLDVNINM